MNSFQLRVQKALTTMIVWLSFLTIFGYAGLNPRNAHAGLEQEIPAQQKTTNHDITDVPNSSQHKSNSNENKINAPEVDTIIETLTPSKDIRKYSFRGIARETRKSRPPPGEV